MVREQRIMIDGGFTCPNRDGRVGTGGCTYCRNDSFAPEYCRKAGGIREQILAGKKFWGRRYSQMRYIAYFQSYSGTYAPVEVLRQRYDEALSDTEVCGLLIGTRPDCLGQEVLDLLCEYNRRTHVEVEIGVESCHNHVLERINRGHTWEQARDAIVRTATVGIPVGVHMILGLPTETEEQMLEGASMLAELPISSLKLHQLQILKGTRLEQEFLENPDVFHQFPTLESYLEVVRKYMAILPETVRLERFLSQSPRDILLSPRWNVRSREIKLLR